MEKIWTEKTMLKALVGIQSHGLFNSITNLCVPNVSWGFLNYEADLLILTAAGWLKEVEIKTSISDLKRDILKPKHENWECPTNPVSQLFYAMPYGLWEKVKDDPPIPEHAGIIVVRGMEKYGCDEPKVAKRHKYARKLFLEEKLDIARLASHRYWSLLHRTPNID